MDKRVLSDAKALQLTKVRRVKTTPDRFFPGMFFALAGAWDRKKIMVGRGSDKHGEYVLLQNVGRIFSDGRYVKPTKASAPVRQPIYSDDHQQSRRGYVAVVPAGTTAKKLVVVTDYEGPRRRDRENYHKKWKETRAQEIREEIAQLQHQLDELLR